MGSIPVGATLNMSPPHLRTAHFYSICLHLPFQSIVTVACADFPYDALIFNLDGVLVDTSGHHYTAWRRLANSLGFDFTLEQHEMLRGLSRMASLEQLLEWGGVYLTEAEKLHWSDIKNNWYMGLISTVGPDNVLPGALNFLEILRSKNIKTALVSASKSARQVLETTRLTPYFEVILDGHAFRKSIPDPECFQLAARTLDIPPAQCLVFEDSALGVQAGLFGGFTVVGIGRKEYLEKAHTVVPGFHGLTLETLKSILPASKTVSIYS